jgi:hypothetical protein
MEEVKARQPFGILIELCLFLLWVTVLVVLELVTFAKRLHLPPRLPLPRLSTLFVSSIL